MTARNSSRGSSSIEPRRSMPALLTSTSIGPCWAMMSAIPRRTESSESTSIDHTMIGRDSAAAVAPSSGALAGSRMVPITRWPARASARHVALPIPRLAPVTRTDATFSLSGCRVAFDDQGNPREQRVVVGDVEPVGAGVARLELEGEADGGAGRLVGQLDRAGQRRAELAVGEVGAQRQGVTAARLAGADRHEAEQADDRGGRVERVAARIDVRRRQRHAVD